MDRGFGRGDSGRREVGVWNFGGCWVWEGGLLVVLCMCSCFDVGGIRRVEFWEV